MGPHHKKTYLLEANNKGTNQPVHLACAMAHSDLILTLYLIETPFNAFANRAYPDQAALLRAAELPDQGLLCIFGMEK